MATSHYLSRTLLAAAVAALSACASATTGPAGAPPRVGDVAAYAFNDELYLCNGVSISNAPAADSYRKVIGYRPTARVNGVTLARAPVDACISSAYGPRRGGAGAFHDGLDLYTGSPRPAHAGASGVVEFAGVRRGYGNVVRISHGNGVATRYAHLSSISPRIKPGARVATGEVIGQTGRTGNATAVHLHYEILVGGRAIDPLRAGD